MMSRRTERTLWNLALIAAVLILAAIVAMTLGAILDDDQTQATASALDAATAGPAVTPLASTPDTIRLDSRSVEGSDTAGPNITPAPAGDQRRRTQRRRKVEGPTDDDHQ